MSIVIAYGEGDSEIVLLQGASQLDEVFVIGPDRVGHAHESCFYVVFSPKATAGAVSVETAHEKGYLGKWDQLGKIAWNGPDRVQYLGVPGIHLALRVRVSEAIRGGTVSVYGIGKS